MKKKEEDDKMTYRTYLKFYKLTDSTENRENWLYNEWHHGRAYLYKGEFFSTTTGEKMK